MPYILGVLILILVAVMIIIKFGDSKPGQETEMKTDKVVSDLVGEDEAQKDTVNDPSEGTAASPVQDDDGAGLGLIPDKGTPETDPDGTDKPMGDTASTEGSEPETVTEPAPTATPTPVPEELVFEDKDDYIETKNDVNLRVGPSTDTDIVTNLKTGKRLKRTGYNEKWTRIIYEEKECYIYTPLVTGVFEEPTEDGNATGGKSSGTATLSTGVGTSNGHIVCIDPGHQTNGNNDKEPLGPGSSEMKAKVSSGTSGNTTGHPEYKLNLTVSLKLRDELIARGYTVVMTREINDVNLSNAERAKIAADAGAQAFIRIHANSSTDTSVNGVETICMTSDNKYNADLYTSSRKLSDAVLNNVVSNTGAKKRYVWETDTMTGINWAEGPVTILEMGYMSNKDEEEKLLDDDYQNKIVIGIANGIDEFFK